MSQSVIKNKMSYVSKLRSNYTKRCSLLERDLKGPERKMLCML